MAVVLAWAVVATISGMMGRAAGRGSGWRNHAEVPQEAAMPALVAREEAMAATAPEPGAAGGRLGGKPP